MKIKDFVTEAKDDDMFAPSQRTVANLKDDPALNKRRAKQIKTHPQQANDLEALRRLQEAAGPFLEQFAQFTKYYEGWGSGDVGGEAANLKNFLFKRMPKTIAGKYEYKPEYHAQGLDATKHIRIKPLK